VQFVKYALCWAFLNSVLLNAGIVLRLKNT